MKPGVWKVWGKRTVRETVLLATSRFHAIARFVQLESRAIDPSLCDAKPLQVADANFARYRSGEALVDVVWVAESGARARYLVQVTAPGVVGRAYRDVLPEAGDARAVLSEERFADAARGALQDLIAHSDLDEGRILWERRGGSGDVIHVVRR